MSQKKSTKTNPKADGALEAVEPSSGLDTVVIRNEFYRDGYRSLLKLTVIMSVIILALIVVLLGVVNARAPDNRYFATTEDGRLIPMIPLNSPNLSTPALMSWVTQASTDVMSFGFSNYRRRLQESSRNFTRRGWESFSTALGASGIVETVEARKQTISAVPAGAPILQQEGVVAGRYQWVFQIPLALSYEAGANRSTQRMIVTVVVVRVPRLESANGVGIDRWIAQAR